MQFPIDWDYLDIDFEYQDRDRTIPSDTLRSQRTFECESIDPSLWKATTLKVYRNITSIALRAPGVLRWVSWAHKVEAMCFLPDTSNCIKWKKWQWSQMSINALATYYIFKNYIQTWAAKLEYLTIDIPQNGNLPILLPLWFYVKSISADFWRPKIAILNILAALNFWHFWHFWSFQVKKCPKNQNAKPPKLF